jgi:hypothetical protein
MTMLSVLGNDWLLRNTDIAMNNMEKVKCLYSVEQYGKKS